MGRVIRAQRIGAAVVPDEVYTAHGEAARIREAAQLEAAAIRARAEAEADAIRSSARADGYADGHAAAAQQHVDLAHWHAQLRAEDERAATQAALLVAAELVGSTLQSEPERILGLLAPHLTRLRRAHRLVLRLHPDDAAWLHTHAPELAALGERLQWLSEPILQPDPALARGDCVLESSIGELDARLDTRLTLLAAALQLPPLPGSTSASEVRS
ncbi:MAG: FliH/SctL family protein [Polyangiales bacterium]